MDDAKYKIYNVFFREKPVELLLGLLKANNEVYASTLAKSIDCTYSHVVKILQEMEKAKLIEFDKQGRLKLLTLTDKGREIAVHMDKIKQLL